MPGLVQVGGYTPAAHSPAVCWAQAVSHSWTDCSREQQAVMRRNPPPTWVLPLSGGHERILT